MGRGWWPAWNGVLVVLAGLVGGLEPRVAGLKIASGLCLDLELALAVGVGEVRDAVRAHALGVLEIPGLHLALLGGGQRLGGDQLLAGLLGRLELRRVGIDPVSRGDADPPLAVGVREFGYPVGAHAPGERQPIRLGRAAGLSGAAGRRPCAGCPGTRRAARAGGCQPGRAGEAGLQEPGPPQPGSPPWLTLVVAYGVVVHVAFLSGSADRALEVVVRHRQLQKGLAAPA